MIQNTRSTQFCSKRVISPETFKAEQQYGITLLISEDAQIKSFLTNLLTQSEEWIVKKKVSKLSLIILNVANKKSLSVGTSTFSTKMEMPHCRRKE
ncbi:hypothetical protein MSG28_007795 [Choristoneura fumiferana]|uniref:Uncharacterized protein n=1 Tax=Choristoneura fumiferana TaxID=7141 RepID=A0ACC0JYY3_CHOFU|nr:hypothetical protein MSG28_007795 [Choristoneura fumiferana]